MTHRHSFSELAAGQIGNLIQIWVCRRYMTLRGWSYSKMSEGGSWNKKRNFQALYISLLHGARRISCCKIKSKNIHWKVHRSTPLISYISTIITQPQISTSSILSNNLLLNFRIFENSIPNNKDNDI